MQKHILVKYFKYYIVAYCVYTLSSYFKRSRCLVRTLQYDGMAQGSLDGRKTSYDSI